jgi:hypothetical protein
VAVVEDLGIPHEEPVDEEVPQDQFADEEIDETYLSEEDRDFVDQMVARTVMFCEELADMELRPYQREMAGRIVESVILADGEEITGCWCRQSGKSQTLAIVVAGMLVLFPKLALSFDMFERFKRGFWVGMYAPVDNQSEFIFTKVMDILKSEHAKVFLTDPEIDEKVTAGSKLATLKSGSYVRRQTANPKAKIEGASYHLVIVDEAQDVDDLVVRKSIAPMLASVAGSMVKIGTPSFHKGDFHRAIQLNKRRATKRGGKRFHFEYDYKVVSKYNPYYAKFIKREKIRIGEESDEFLMSYALKWQLDRGMLVTEDELDYLADPSMAVEKAWFRSPVVVGIDPARVQDSTVVTVCWVDWDHPDPAGYREHRILNWLEIQNTDYEEQYFAICEFLEHYDVAYVGVDAQGMGGPMADRLQRLLGHRCDVVPLTSDLKNQSERWQYLIQLLQRRMIVYPGHSKARRLRSWKRFRQQMEDAEKLMRGNYLLIQAPDDTRDSHDDYVDSLALACMMSQHDTVPEAEISSAPWFR